MIKTLSTVAAATVALPLIIVLLAAGPPPAAQAYGAGLGGPAERASPRRHPA